MAPPKPPLVSTPPVTAAPVTAAPVTAQEVFAQLQQQRGFSPLGGVDPNAQVPPSIYSRTDATQTRADGADPNDVRVLKDLRQKEFGDAQQANSQALENLRVNPNSPAAKRRLAEAEADFQTSREAVMKAQGPLERRQYATQGGSAEGVVPRGAGRGGFAGSATDAEAARNLQARAEQDAAASQIAAGFDRTTERLRDNRAEAMGISRAKLDASEGRGNPLASLFAPQGQQATSNPFSQPGDGFGDAELRRSALERKMGDTRLPKAERQAAAGAYQGFLGPSHGAGPGGPANGHSPDLFNIMDKMQDNQRADQNLALQGQQLQETRRANQFNQNLRVQQEQRASVKQYSDQGKAANEAILKDRTQYIKDHSDKKTGYMPQMDQIANFGVWAVQNSPELQRKQPDLAQRILDGTLRYEDWGTLDRMHKAFESSKPGWYNPFGSPASADEITQRYFDFNAPK